jgi:hypothetical protein
MGKERKFTLFGCADIFPLEKMKSKAKKREK